MKTYRLACTQSRHTVSILVVVEWSYEADPLYQICAEILSFNPCCSGMILWRSFCRAHRDKAKLVSILVVVEWSYEAPRASKASWSSALVSILVVVEWSYEENAGHVIWRLTGSFNPCCSGMILWRQCRFFNKIVHIGVSILVVVEWSYEGRRRVRGTTSGKRRFNPCCSGMILWSPFYVYRLKRQ